ncbi:hypothetical protein VTL71DRAFT_10334 [Oculimacula yallundae]|uniref:Ankyrin n=1 Tax=Oculimacula yallundae TaxID=86028 RepID=A0ABR4CST1_9HELO
MDPFSLVVGLVGLSDAATRTASTLFQLVDAWRDAPRDVHHLRDSVVSVGEFFARVHHELDEHITCGHYSESTYVLQTSNKLLLDLKIAQKVLEQIDQILDFVGSTDRVAGKSLKSELPPDETARKLRKDRWLRRRGALLKLQKSLTEIQSTIFEGLLSMNVTLTTDILSRIRKVQEDITFLKSGDEMQPEILLSRITDTVQASNVSLSASVSQQIEISHTRLIDQFRGHLQQQLNEHATLMDKQIKRNSYLSNVRHPLRQILQSSITANIVHDESRISDDTCDCRCHVLSTTKEWVYEKCKGAFGSIALSYTTRPRRASSCRCCNISHGRWIRATYTFPMWLFNLSLYMLYRRNAGGSPEVLLRVVNHIPDDASRLHSTIVGCIQRRDVFAAGVMLQSRRASVFDIYGRQDRTLLIQACFIKDATMARLLIKHGADPLAPEALSYRSLYPRMHTYWKFLCNEVGLNIPISAFFSDAGLTELHRIVVGTMPISLGEALLLNRYNRNINATDSRGCTPLHYAASMGNADHVSLLTKHGANIEARNAWKSTPLYEACLTGSYEVAEVLLRFGAHVDARVQHNATPLRMACDYGSPKLVALLLEYGADFDAMNFRGNCKLDAVVYNDNVDVFRFLLEKASIADLDQQDVEGETFVFKAIAWDAVKCTKVVLERNPDLLIINKAGQNLLHKLAASAKVEVLEMFTRLPHARLAGLDATAHDRYGRKAQDLFNERPGLTEELREAFNLLISMTILPRPEIAIMEIIDTEKISLVGKVEVGYDDSDNDDNNDEQFFDAPNVLFDLGKCS